MHHIKVGTYRIPVPRNPVLRIGLGVLMVFGGLLGFLPILGFWMAPVGVAITAIDFPPARRLHRRATVHTGTWLDAKFPRVARFLGFGARRERS